MHSSHYEARFGGSGGQGMMLMGDVLARAAGILENREVLLTKSYGPESRGGACRSELIVDSGPINYPAVTRPDFVLAMTQTACDAYHKDLAADGVLLVDSGLVTAVPGTVGRVFAIPLTKIAVEATGQAITANVAALGAVAVLGRAAGAESIRRAILERFPEHLHGVNEKAFAAGMAAATEAAAKEQG